AATAGRARPRRAGATAPRDPRAGTSDGAPSGAWLHREAEVDDVAKGVVENQGFFPRKGGRLGAFTPEIAPRGERFSGRSNRPDPRARTCVRHARDPGATTARSAHGACLPECRCGGCRTRSARLAGASKPEVVTRVRRVAIGRHRENSGVHAAVVQ